MTLLWHLHCLLCPHPFAWTQCVTGLNQGSGCGHDALHMPALKVTPEVSETMVEHSYSVPYFLARGLLNMAARVVRARDSEPCTAPVSDLMMDKPLSAGWRLAKQHPLHRVTKAGQDTGRAGRFLLLSVLASSLAALVSQLLLGCGVSVLG